MKTGGGENNRVISSVEKGDRRRGDEKGISLCSKTTSIQFLSSPKGAPLFANGTGTVSHESKQPRLLQRASVKLAPTYPARLFALKGIHLSGGPQTKVRLNFSALGEVEEGGKKTFLAKPAGPGGKASEIFLSLSHPSGFLIR